MLVEEHTDSVVSIGAVRLSGSVRQAASRGGDFWVWRRLTGRRVLLAIGDVMGHGPSSARTAAECRRAFITTVAVRRQDVRPGEMVAALDRVVEGTFASCCVACIGADGTVEIANAAHPFPLVIGSGKDRPRAVVARGVRLGDGATSRYGEATVTLGGGGRICLYTDGIIEQLGPNGDTFSEKRLRSVLHQSQAPSPDFLVAEVLDAVDNFAAGIDQGDDYGIVVASFEGSRG